MKINLARALRVNRDAFMAFVGSGGKTSAINLLAAEINPPVIVTTSTNMGRSQLKIGYKHIECKHPSQLANLFPLEKEIIFVTGGAIGVDRMTGIGEPSLFELSRQARKYQIPILIEADGSRGLPLKAPASHEPNIPEWANQVVTIGLSCLDKLFTSEVVHRFDEAKKIMGLTREQKINIESIRTLLCHPNGGLKNIPNKARKIVLLNQVDTRDIQNQGEALARQLLGSYDAIVLASMTHEDIPNRGGIADSECIYKVVESTAGVVLAAGESSRYGSPKLLNDWKGVPIIRHVAVQAIQAGLSPVIIVLGAIQEPIINAIKDLSVTFVINSDWQKGQSTSLRSGIEVLPTETGSAIFLLADQPQIPIDLITALKYRHEESLATLIIPQVQGKRANPVLFDRVAFDNLKKVKGDQGGRAIFDDYQITWLPWQDGTILMDMDTPEDYQKLLNIC
jgi:molybdenum cofactor cytidylyltransferase